MDRYIHTVLVADTDPGQALDLDEADTARSPIHRLSEC